MRLNPITAAAALAAAVTVDVVVVALAAVALLWQQQCPDGFWTCPAPADRAGHEALALAILGGVLVLVAVAALLRGRMLVAALQVVLVVVLAVAAQQALPAAFAQLRSHVGLSAPAS
jgi:hypothetical protein